MKITEFNKKLTELEGKKRQVSIAQMAEITASINKLTKGMFYKFIRVFLILILCFSFSFAQTPYNYWSFDNPSNPVNGIRDSIGNFNLGTGPSFTPTAGGKVGKYANFDAALGLVTFSPDFVALKDSFAFEFIFKPGRLFNTTLLISSQGVTAKFVWPDNSFVRPYIEFYTEKTNGQFDNMQIVLDGIGRKNWGWFTDGNWHHMVFQYNCATGRKEIWVDGELPAGFNKTTATGGAILSGNTCYLNSTINYVKYYGAIDEIATHRRLLTGVMIREHYNNMVAGTHYSYTTGLTSVLNSAVTGPVDPDDYPTGSTQTSVTYTVQPGTRGYDDQLPGTVVNQPWSYNVTKTPEQQLRWYPLPRYKTGHTMLPNVDICGLNYAGGNGQGSAPITTPGLYTPITQAQKKANMLNIATQVAQKWNMHIQIGIMNGKGAAEFGNPNDEDGMLIKLANDSVNFPLGVGSYRPWGRVHDQTLSAVNYMQNGSGQFVNYQGAVDGTKYHRLTNNPANYAQDGVDARNTLNAMISFLPNRPATKKVDLIWENAEWYNLVSESTVANDPVLNAARIASGLDWYTFISRKYYEFNYQSYPGQFMTLPGLAQTTYQEYAIGGSNQYQFKWSEARKINTPQIQNDYMSTSDYYASYPHNWGMWAGFRHGIQWASITRAQEIGDGDEFCSPYVCAGWYPDEEKNMRPGQYLGLIKNLYGMGAKRTFNSYFVLFNPFPLPENWIWQMVHPNYAQAAVSHQQAEFDNSKVLPGDYPTIYTTGSDSSFRFHAGDLRKIVTVRKVNGAEKYLIFGSVMNNTNQYDTLSLVSSATITVPTVGSLTFQVRRQGSIYYLDNTTPSAPIWYQLDGWHEAKHPDKWSQDMIYEAELADAGSPTIATEGISGTDYTNAVAYTSLTNGQTASYRVQRSDLSTTTRYFWIRARSTTGASCGVNITGMGTAKKINCITGTSWAWYRVDSLSQIPIVFSSMTSGVYTLTLTAINSIQIDKIALIESSANVYSATNTICSGGVVATITPSGATTFCTGGSVQLSANASDSYLWSTGATSQSINVVTSGNYVVTVTQGGISATSAVTVVTVNTVPAQTLTLSPANQSICPSSSVTLGISAGSGLTYQWYKDGVIIPATGITYNTNVAGSYSAVVTNAAGCTQNLCCNVISTYPSASATITPAGPTTFCTGGSVSLSANSSTSYLWSTGATTQAITASTTGIYTVTVTNANGCTATANKSVTVNAYPTATITSPGTTFCQGSTILLTANTGTGYTYQWNQNGIPIVGATSSTYTASVAGTYTISTTVNSCTTTSNSIVLTMVATLTTANAGPDQNVCGTTATLAGNTITNGTGTWSLVSGSGTITTPTSPTTTVTGLATGASVFKWTVTGSPCTSNSDNVTITKAASNAASVTITPSANPFCNGASVTFTANPVNGGTPSYQWKVNGVNVGTNSVTYSAVFANADQVTVVMTSSLVCATGSPATSAATVMSASTVSSTITSTDTDICQGDSCVLTANASTSYQWKNASGNIIGATSINYSAKVSGTYSCIVTNAQGCSLVSNSIAVNVFATPTASIAVVGGTAICPGATTVLQSNSAIDYVWSTGATTQAITVGTVGTYSVTITDVNGCTAIAPEVEIIAGSGPTATFTPSNDTTLCVGKSLLLTGNTGAGLVYQWYKDGTAIASATNSNYTINSEGTYHVMVSNGAFCSTTSADIKASYVALPSATITNSASVFCAGSSSTLTAATNTSYLWNTGAITKSISVTTAGTYTVTVTNSSGCTKVGSTSVLVNPKPTVSIYPPSGVLCGSGFITFSASPGSAYLWNTGQTSQSINTSAVGTYTVTVTDGNGCSNYALATVTDTCTGAGCIAPYNLLITNVSWWSAKLSFSCTTPDIGFRLYLKNTQTGKIYEPTYSKNSRSISLWGLRSKTTYELYMVSLCTSSEKMSVTKTFKTK